MPLPLNVPVPKPLHHKTKKQAASRTRSIKEINYVQIIAVSSSTASLCTQEIERLVSYSVDRFTNTVSVSTLLHPGAGIHSRETTELVFLGG